MVLTTMTANDDRRRGSWEIVEETLTQLSIRLGSIESRLTQLEMPHNRQVVLNERLSIDSSGLGGRQISTDSQGAIQRQILIAKCDICGRRLFEDEAYKICSFCERRLCSQPSKCSVTLTNGNTVCIHCLRTKFFPLDKSLDKVCLCVANNVQSIDAISNITHIDKRGVEHAMTELKRLELVAKKGVFPFASHHVLDRGLEAIAAFRQIWGEDYDMLVFDAELRRHLSQRTGSAHLFLGLGSPFRVTPKQKGR
jgi:hypothetical protein